MAPLQGGGTPATDVHRPDWVRDAVFYQIFPDRFARGPRASTDVQPWESVPTRDNFLGGDLDGIAGRLGHLSDLGITAVYLTPVFAAGTNHRYDTTDYLRIDPRLGDDASFDRLVDAARRYGIRLVLDAVFHHCGYGHWAFQDVVAHGADSRYAGWFTVERYPVQARPRPTYATCSGCWYLPKLNVGNPELRAHLMEVARHWTARGIDGWRLDVPYMMDAPDFWAQFRSVVRAQNPDAYLVAEVWAAATEWTSGQTTDAAMNYRLRDALLAFLVERRSGADELAREVAAIDVEVGADATGHMLNLLASHDTARTLTTCGGERGLSLLATRLLLSLRGAPMLYYGDEVGLRGFNDPECRGAMPWSPDRWDTETLSAVAEWVRLRRGSVALRRGDQEVSAVDEDVVRVRRRHPVQTVDVIANRAAYPRTVTLEVPARDLVTGRAVDPGPLDLPARGICVLERTGDR